MARYLIVVVIALIVPLEAAAAVRPVRAMFVDASQQEQAVRTALADPAVSAAVLKSVRHTVASYESVVRRYPTSSYSDDALWQAARLALDGFGRFGDVQDRETGLRLLRWLATEYPASRFAKQVPALLNATQNAPKDAAARKPRSVNTGAGRTEAVETGNAVSKATAGAAVSKPAPVAPKREPSPAAAPKTASITRIQRTLLPDVVRVTIALDAEVAFHDERIAGPSRIFIDFPATRAAGSLTDRTLRFDDDRDLVRQVRIGQQPNASTRVVLDAAGISSYSVYPVYNPYRLVIDCVRAAPAPQERSASASAWPPPAAVKPPPGNQSTSLPVPNAANNSIRLPGSNAAPTWTAPDPVALASARPAAPIAPPRPAPPIIGRSVATTWTDTVTAATPAGALILEASRAPAVLAIRSVGNGWGSSLPNSRPVATAAIRDATRAPATLKSRTVTNGFGRALPNISPAATAAISSALAPAPAAPAALVAASAVPPPPLPSRPPALGLGTGFSMARQLGLGVSRIVIDPGHGGHDPGAKGKGGTTEAELVLDVSLRLEALLEEVPGVEVILTRHADEFVPLAERTALANREGADLFLSIHANASPNDQAHGVETYFLNFANNLTAAAVAARENATSGQAMGALPDFVRAIALNNKLDESRDFATLVQQAMLERLRPANKMVKDLGVKQAPFVVLIGASMPSVLAEISFLTHEQEAKLLKSSDYRQRIAEALFDAVQQYQGSLKRVQTVAHQ